MYGYNFDNLPSSLRVSAMYSLDFWVLTNYELFSAHICFSRLIIICIVFPVVFLKNIAFFCLCFGSNAEVYHGVLCL